MADFRSGVPDLASFPRGDWMWAQREACRTAPNEALDYGDPRGSPVLREVLAAYLRRVRAAAADPEHLVICTGFAQGLGLALRVLRRAGTRRVAIEDPGYDDAAQVAAWADVEVIRVPVDSGGIDVGRLAATGAQAVVLSPAHQWPTGVVLAAARRHALAAWAASTDAIIIEDDYDAEFRYDREPVGALQGLAPDRVIALGTVSKSLAPALRLGWLVCPPALTAAIAEEKEYGDRGSPVLDQLALAKLIESGRFDRHLRRMRGVYASAPAGTGGGAGPARARGEADRPGGRLSRRGASARASGREVRRRRSHGPFGRTVWNEHLQIFRCGPARAIGRRFRQPQRADHRGRHRRGRRPAPGRVRPRAAVRAGGRPRRCGRGPGGPVPGSSTRGRARRR